MAKKATENPIEQTEVVYETAHISEADMAIEKRLVALYTLQRVDSEIDKIQIIRGELPQAIEDLEDEIAGLQTRIEKLRNDVANNKEKIAEEKRMMAEHNDRINVLKEQQNNVHNNREYETINKELEYKDLEVQLCERHIKDANARIKELESHIDAAQKSIEDRSADLNTKREELDSIIAETEQEEQRLQTKSAEQETFIEERYLTAFKRIRKAARNGLAVVPIDRDACGGCFSKIPPQRQMEIKMHKKVIVCENCGRILVDDDIAMKANEILNK